jgi:hypothetical protein
MPWLNPTVATVQRSASSAVNIRARETTLSMRAAEKPRPSSRPMRRSPCLPARSGREQQVQATLESRAAIDQAKGILLQRHKLTVVQAF